MSPADKELVRIANALIKIQAKDYLDRLNKIYDPDHHIAESTVFTDSEGREMAYSPEIVYCLKAISETNFEKILTVKQANLIFKEKNTSSLLLNYFLCEVSFDEMPLEDILEDILGEALC